MQFKLFIDTYYNGLAAKYYIFDVASLVSTF